MSFINLTTLSDHRRQEMAERIHVFMKKCDYAAQNIEKLKNEARGFISQLNCDPLELKDQFLACVKKLEEYSYLISDFNLALENYVDSGTHAPAPVLDMTSKVLQPSPFNLMDTLSGSVPSTSKTLNKPQCRSKKKKVPKEDQLLISFSSGSSEESIPMAMAQKCMITETINNVQLDDEINARLPGQQVLQVDCEYMAVILYADGLAFWVTTDVIEEAFQLGALMTEYYKHNKVELSLDQVMSLGYCAVYDDSGSYSRALFIQLNKDTMTLAQIYLIDYGETILVPTYWLQPLMPQFCRKPPYARCCHLAGVDIDYDNTQAVRNVESLMRMYMGKNCKIYIDDNNSESLGVYVIAEDGVKLNDAIIAKGLCEKTEDKSTRSDLSNEFPGLTAENCDITQIPEHDDPVVAVTGYHNRDEADICKHYKGGPNKTCFKGNRCLKRHVVKHPDGWTLDRVSVPVKLKPMQLPQVGTFLRVTVSHVPHFDHFYVQIIDTEDNPELGGVIPPTSLSSLILNMNCSTTKAAYKPLQMIPAPGELVASLYPIDGKWYRATVLSSTGSDQSVEIKYVDYGNVIWVKEDTLRELDPRFLMLPPQAILCTLAGVTVRNPTSGSYIAARKTLEAMLQDNRFDAEVIDTGYDKLTVALYDEKGSNVADLLAAQKVVERQEISGTVRQNFIVVP